MIKKLLILLTISSLFAQEENIVIDGILSETVWNLNQGDFTMNMPQDSIPATNRTYFQIILGDKGIYFAAKAEIDQGKYFVESLQRDFEPSESESIGLALNPFGDEANGYFFAVNPYGAQMEGLIQNSGAFGPSEAWDNVWEAAAQRNNEFWTLEFFIPYRSFKFISNTQEWKYNVVRNDLSTNQVSTWFPVTQGFDPINMVFYKSDIQNTKEVKSKRSVAIIPYAAFNVNQNNEVVPASTEVKPNVGVDAKIGIGTGLTLDLTINPDFSQAEVDNQVTNLSRFSLFFPERRNFFLENSDLLNNYGFSKIRPFFSRRIGLNNGRIVPILGGARLSGKLGKDWRIGVMTIQEEGGSWGNSYNYSVLAVQRKVFKASNLAFIAVNKQGFNKEGQWLANDYNRIVGFDYNMVSANSRWRGKAFFHYSLNNQELYENNYTHALWLRYQTKKFQFDFNHEYVGHNYFADLGFVPRQFFYNPRTDLTERRTYWRLEPIVRYRFFPKNNNSPLAFHGPRVYYSDYMDANFLSNDQIIEFGYDFEFKDRSALSFEANKNNVFLEFPVDVTFDGQNAYSEGRYQLYNMGVSYESAQGRLFGYELAFYTGDYYEGNRIYFLASAKYRIQPYIALALEFEQNEFYMGGDYQNTYFTLLRPRIDVTLNKSMFFTSMLQYNTQIDNAALFLRFQWRFKPMSDFFVVYTNNLHGADGRSLNSGLAVKFVYWINT